MQLGDLTSGVNMLPDNSLNKGIQDYFKQEGSISAQKGQLAQNKINEVNNLLNVNLKGLQSQDMNEAVAARDSLIKNATEAARNSKDLGDIPWTDMKKLLAQKSSLEQMAQQSSDTQKLYATRYQQVLSLRDPIQREQALKNLNAIHNLPSIAARNAHLNNFSLPEQDYTMKDLSNEIKLVSRTPTSQNKQLLANGMQTLVDTKNPAAMYFYDKQKAANPDATDEEIVSSMTKAVTPWKLGGLTFANKQNITNEAKNVNKAVNLNVSPNGNLVSAEGVGKKGTFLIERYTDTKNNKSYNNAYLTGFRKNKGKWQAAIVVPISNNVPPLPDKATDKEVFTHAMALITSGKSKDYKVIYRDASGLGNMLTNRNIHIKGAPDLLNAVYKGVSAADPLKLF